MNTTKKYFTNCLTLDALTKERNRLARIHHPDVGGDVATMQDINAEFEQAKKRLSLGAPGPDRYYVRPQQPQPQEVDWEKLMREQMERMANWAKDVERQQREQERGRYRDTVQKQQDRLRNEVEWAREELRKMQRNGELRGCHISLDFTKTTLEVFGKETYNSKEKLKRLGFRWDGEGRKWRFYRMPASARFTDFDDDDEEDEEDDDEIPF